MIGGIVLAAGRSRRMGGEPKGALTLGGQSFVARAVDVLREGGCQAVCVVVGIDPGAGRVIFEVESMRAGQRAEWLQRATNDDPDAEQIDSLRLGLRAMPDQVEAALVLPVDVPTAEPAVAAALIDAYRRTGAPIVLPTLHGRHGHPVLFGRPVWAELLQGDLPDGARTVIHADPDRRVEVPVDTLPADVDTPDDYRRLLEDPRWSA